MKNWHLVFASAFIAVLATIILYQPLSVLFFKLQEPYFLCPIKTESGKMVIRNDAGGSGQYGAKRRGGRLHSGIDILAPAGTPVYASRSGMAFCGKVPTGYGKYVMIYHPDGTQTFYGHLSSYSIPSVQKVRKGDLIGLSGKTGNASSKFIEPHLHFEIRKDGKPQDPQGLMK